MNCMRRKHIRISIMDFGYYARFVCGVTKPTKDLTYQIVNGERRIDRECNDFDDNRKVNSMECISCKHLCIQDRVSDALEYGCDGVRSPIDLYALGGSDALYIERECNNYELTDGTTRVIHINSEAENGIHISG